MSSPIRIWTRLTAVSASLGAVSCNYAIHSAAGLKRGNKKAQDLVDEMKGTVKARWRLVKAIIIEEFSMLSADFLDLLDGVARIMKKKREPFGGGVHPYCG